LPGKKETAPQESRICGGIHPKVITLQPLVSVAIGVPVVVLWCIVGENTLSE